MRDLRKFRTHLEILKHSHPELVIQLAPEPSNAGLVVELAGEGSEPALKWNGKLLHSAKAPETEAGRLLETFQFESNRVYIIFGVGPGHLALQALQRLPERANLVLYEPEIRILREVLGGVDLRPLLFDPRVAWVSGREWRQHMMIHLRRAEKAGMRPSTTILSLPAYRTYFRAALEETRSLLAQFINEREIDTQTRKTLTQLWNRNLVENLPHVLASTPLNLLTTTFQNVPFVLVGAGPSLDDSIDTIRRLKSGAVVVAVDTALAPLLACGCVPDMVVAMDAQEENARDFDGLPPHNSLLVFDAFCHPSIPILYPSSHRIVAQTGHVLSDIDQVVVVKNGLLGLLDHLLDYENGFLQNGGSVITGAFDLARISGGSAVGLTGVDFSFPGYLSHSKLTNKYHAAIRGMDRFSTPETDRVMDMSRRSRMRLDGARGGHVWSDRVLVQYKHWMEDAAKRSGIPCFLIGDSRGAKLAGYTPVDADEFLKRFAVSRADIDGRLARCRNARPKFDPAAALLRLQDIRLDVARLETDPAIDRIGPFDLDRFVEMASFEVAEKLREVLANEPESEHLTRRRQAARACRQWVTPFLDRLEKVLGEEAPGV